MITATANDMFPDNKGKITSIIGVLLAAYVSTKYKKCPLTRLEALLKRNRGADR